MVTNVFAFLLGASLLAPCLATAFPRVVGEVKSVKTIASPDWKSLAPKVGMSEEFRERALRDIKRIPHLKEKLREGLKGPDRPLALEAIGALEMGSLVPDMVDLLKTDRDGFLTLAVNAMMTPANQNRILNKYLELLPDAGVPAQIAMLEPLGRLGIDISRKNLLALSKSDSPDLRSALIYYVRIIGLRHHSFDNVDLVRTLAHARELQVRLQAESVLTELESMKVAGP